MAFAFPDAARRPTVGIQFIRTSLGVGREATRYKDAGLAERGLLKRWGRAGLCLPQAVVPPRRVAGSVQLRRPEHRQSPKHGARFRHRRGDARLTSLGLGHLRSDDRDVSISIQFEQAANRPGKTKNKRLGRKAGKITRFNAANVTFWYARFLRHLERCHTAFSASFPDLLTNEGQRRQLDDPFFVFHFLQPEGEPSILA